MAAHDEDIFPSVVVVIDEAIAPAKKWDGGSCDARVVAYIGEIQIAVTPKPAK